jgi:hypothetical protein
MSDNEETSQPNPPFLDSHLSFFYEGVKKQYPGKIVNFTQFFDVQYQK